MGRGNNVTQPRIFSSKDPGLDEIPSFFLASVLALQLALVSNLSMLQGVVPDNIKLPELFLLQEK